MAEWIDIRDQRPLIYDDVLTCIAGGSIVRQDYWLPITRQWHDHKASTHWQPMPDGPYDGGTGWTQMAEEMPKTGGRYICYGEIDGYKYRHVCDYDPEEQKFYYLGYRQDNATWWQPVPTPKQEART